MGSGQGTDHFASEGHLRRPEFPVLPNLTDGKDKGCAKNDSDIRKGFTREAEKKIIGLEEHLPRHEALWWAAIRPWRRRDGQLNHACRIVDSDEDGEEVGLEVETVRLPSLRQIGDPVTADAPVFEKDAIGGMVRTITGRHQSGIGVAEFMVDVSGAASVSIGNGVSLEKDLEAGGKDARCAHGAECGGWIP